jgi:hypothetical protein
VTAAAALLVGHGHALAAQSARRHEMREEATAEPVVALSGREGSQKWLYGQRRCSVRLC